MSAPSIAFTVMLGTALLGATAGVIGTFAVLRGRALVGDMLSHAALPGVCLAFLLTQCRDLIPLSLGALATGLLGIGLLAVIRRWTRTKEDAAIGIILSTFFGVGVVLLSLIQQQGSGHQAGLHSYLFGESAGITTRDVQTIAGVGAFCLLVVVLLYKEFELLAFDPEFAAAQGWPTLALDLVMMGTLAVVTIIGLPICGVILMAALIISPGASARFWSNRLGPLLAIAGLIGASIGILGTWLSSPLPEQWLGVQLLDAKRIPPGPLIVLCGAMLFLFSMCFAPQQGIVARAISELRLRLRIVREHLLRSLYELSEPRLAERPAIEISKLQQERSWSEWQLRLWLRRFASRGWVELADSQVRLTPSGVAASAEVTRTHRLWELFLLESADVPSDHVDRSADDVEHMLPHALIQRLEARLAKTGRLPVTGARVPDSPHEIH